MANQPITQMEEDIAENYPQEEQAPQTYDEKLAASLYADHSSQNQLVIQVFLALAGAGIGYGVEVRDAYAFFAKNKIDAEKLLKDPKYFAQVKKYAGRLNFWEKGAIKGGRSKLGTVLDGTNKAIKEVDVTHKKLVDLKEGLIKDYSRELQNLYGLTNDEIQAITQRVKYAIQKDPNLSMQDLLQREGQLMARGRIEKEIKKEKIDAKLSEMGKEFNQRTRDFNAFEEQNHLELTTSCKRQLDQVIAQPQTTPQTAPTASQAVAPFKFSLPNISLPHIPLPKISFGGFGGRVGLNMGGLLSGGLKSVFGSGGLLSKAGQGLLNLGSKALGLALPPLGTALTALSAIDALTGGIISKGATLVIGGIIILAVGLPIVFTLLLSGGASQMFAHVTSDNPMTIKRASVDDRKYSWSQFEKKFLTLSNDDQTSWSQFAIENLTPENKNLVQQKNLPQGNQP